MKKTLLSAAIAALMGTGIYLAESTTHQNDGLSDINIANAEALADDEGEGRLYDVKVTKEMEIWDEENGIHQKIIVTTCEGKGVLECK